MRPLRSRHLKRRGNELQRCSLFPKHHSSADRYVGKAFRRLSELVLLSDQHAPVEQGGLADEVRGSAAGDESRHPGAVDQQIDAGK